MEAEKLPIIHFVDVIRRNNQREQAVMLLQQMKVLKNCVGGSRIAFSNDRGGRNSEFLMAGSNATPCLFEICGHGFTLVLG